MSQAFLRILFGLAAVFTSGCSTVQTRIEDHPDLYSQLSPPDRDLVRKGSVREGMSRDAVFLAWGKPDAVAEGRREGDARERWTWFAYHTELVDDYQYDAPLFYGRGRYLSRRSTQYYPVSTRYPYRHAIFEGNRLVEWETMRGI